MKNILAKYILEFCRPRSDMSPPELLPEGYKGGVRIGFAVISSTMFLTLAGGCLAVTAWLLDSWLLGISAGWLLRSAIVVLRPLTSPFQWAFEQAARDA